MRCSPSTRRHERGAFTLVELVIVVLVMSILAAVAVPTFFDGLLLHRVEAAARRLKADLELARHQARLTSATQTLTFTGSAYSLTNASSLDQPGAAYIVDLRAAPYELDLATADFAGMSSVSFDGYGIPSTSGTVMLQAKDHACTVVLDGTTGQVTITSNHTRGRQP